MRNTIKFILHSALVFAFIALATAAFTPMAKAEHTPTTSGSWLVAIDWDADGNPTLTNDPIRYDTRLQCGRVGAAMVAYVDAYDPDRRYVSVCAHPDDASDLYVIIDLVIEDFSPFFQPGKGV